MEEFILQYVGTSPLRAYHDDAGLDLTVHDGPWTIFPGETVEIPLGVSCKAPEGTWLLLTGRSSTFRNRQLLVGQGVIDTGYTGPLFAVVHNFGSDPQTVNDGERIAQLILMPNLTSQVTLEEVSRMPVTHRGSNGFGSSGS